MEILFCSNPINFSEVDIDYSREKMAAESNGIKISLFSFEELSDFNKPEVALKRIQTSVVHRLAIYRGWMMKPKVYGRFYNSLLKKGVRLINSDDEYKHCHYLPENYPIIVADITPKSVWIGNDEELSIDRIMNLISVFDNKPLVVKDYVKSQKHYWKEACYITSASDAVNVERIVSRFKELQGGNPEGGFVFREYIKFEPIGIHPKSEMPLTLEYRIFFLYHKPILWLNYWDDGKYGDIVPPLDKFTEIAENVKSNFFTMDIAKTKIGDWLIVELGDAQVAGLPERTNKEEFYKNLCCK